MSEARSTLASPQAGPGASYGDLGATLLRVAWLAILLGLVMQVLLLLVTAAAANLPGVGQVVTQLSQNLSWSVIVCLGLALGTAASSARAALMGLAGVLAAPIAFNAARIVQQSVGEALEIGAGSPARPSVLLVAGLKGLEYACLGGMLGWLGQRPWAGLKAHAIAGLLVGVVFGGMIVTLVVQASETPVSVAAMLSRGVNEIIFPVGCALVIFAAQRLGARMDASQLQHNGVGVAVG